MSFRLVIIAAALFAAGSPAQASGVPVRDLPVVLVSALAAGLVCVRGVDSGGPATACWVADNASSDMGDDAAAQAVIKALLPGLADKARK